MQITVEYFRKYKFSFYSINLLFIYRPFTVDPEKATIWDSTYEESIEACQASDINSENGTKSSHQNTVSIFSISSIDCF